MNNLWPSKTPPTADAAAAADGKPETEATDPNIVDMGPESHSRSNPPPMRPLLLRNQASQPAPPPPPPPPAAPQPPIYQTPSGPAPAPSPGLGPDQQLRQQQGHHQPTDSLSLAQLKRLVADLPRSEAVAYDFEYEDTGPIEEEIDEWFTYQFWQWARLDCVHAVFHREWKEEFGDEEAWESVGDERLRHFMEEAFEGASDKESAERRRDSIRVLLYVVLGRWAQTAGGAPFVSTPGGKPCSAATVSQLEAMKDGIELIAKLNGIPIVWEALKNAFEPFWGDEALHLGQSALQEAQDELTNVMTILYIMIQLVLSARQELADVQSRLLDLKPHPADFMMNATAKLRWDDGALIPQVQMFLLFWKSLLLVFGGTTEIIETKEATVENKNDRKGKDSILASPLDYHAFRQEITSKYPAYIPPQPVIPLEAEQTSLLPPLQNQPSNNNRSNGVLPGPGNSQAGGASILHQPVHIATPAPSPPPSPGVGGKGGKKQNYQTNQNFPFMYPPLDATSNGAGGKGPAGLQDLLVGRKWEGSDVPASILEAGELFSNRVRMSRATRQLWDERERFLRFERGWGVADDDIVDELDLSTLTLEEKEELGLLKSEEPAESRMIPDVEVDYGPRPEEMGEHVKSRLQRLEAFYKDSLPHLQSLVIVLLKAILINNAMFMVQMPPNQQHPAGNARMNGPQGPGRGQSDGPKGPNDNGGNGPDLTLEEVDFARTREIVSKAVSGILLLLLKWFKVSQILKFEYLTQLLLDCNYVPLFLKLWAHWDIQQIVDSKGDRIEHSFFYFCNVRAGHPGVRGEQQPEAEPEPDLEEEEESEDDACPPPIKRRRSPTQAGPDGEPSRPSLLRPDSETVPGMAERDESSFPKPPRPKEPITDFSRRNFFSLINLLRIMQKICKNKAHRNLLLVHYKSSNILRKMLKVPQPELRLYTLKLFKNQVPYCGRKWRQTNMPVITAVYLHCRPELRDEWLAGADVDTEVEESLPLEQGLRSLTHWFNVRRYPDRMGGEVRAALREEQDFFVRELERMDFTWEMGGGDGESVMSEWEGMG